MKHTVAMMLEGVLMKPVDRSVIPQGRMIYQGLASVATVVLISGETPREELDDWMLTENLVLHANVMYPDVVKRRFSVPESLVLQVNRLRHQGYAVELVIVPDPEIAAAVITQGYNCLQFLHAAYALPSWRPDYEHKIRPWNELAAEVAEQARLRSMDEKIRRDREAGNG